MCNFLGPKLFQYPPSCILLNASSKCILSFAKSVLGLGLTAAAASPVNAGIHKIIIGSGITTLIISNEEVEDIKKNN